MDSDDSYSPFVIVNIFNGNYVLCVEENLRIRSHHAYRTDLYRRPTSHSRNAIGIDSSVDNALLMATNEPALHIWVDFQAPPQSILTSNWNIRVWGRCHFPIEAELRNAHFWWTDEYKIAYSIERTAVNIWFNSTIPDSDQ